VTVFLRGSFVLHVVSAERFWKGESNMKRSRECLRWLVVALRVLIIVFFAVPCGVRAQVATTPKEIGRACSQTDAGLATTTLVWESNVGSGGSGARGKGTGTTAQQLEVTTRPSGFDEGNYLILWPARKLSRPVGKSVIPSNTNDRNDPLLRLKVGTVDTSVLGAKSKGTAEGMQTVAVKPENLEAGVNYYWRVSLKTTQGWTSTGIVRVQGKVCPMDRPLNAHEAASRSEVK
jgi:hypothetical protein